MLRKLYSIRQFCAEQGISRSSFYREVKAGRLSVIKCHVMTFVETNEMIRWEWERKKSNRRVKAFSLADWIIRRTQLV